MRYGRKTQEARASKMIVDNQSNIKVHFASHENFDFADVHSKVSNVRYSLYSIFVFIAHSLNIKPQKYGDWSQYIHLLPSMFNHVIMDSGLFTLMFGAHAGKRSAKDIEVWYQALIKWTIANQIKATCVEVDCQKILGVDAAWHYRSRMKKDLPNNRQINVFHKEDGQKGLDRLIEFSDYIAISIPELRKLKQTESAIAIAHYIKNKKPDIDIHLLGCTQQNLLKSLSFCTSADSTSWTQVGRWGVLKYHNGNKTLSINNSSINQQMLQAKYKEDVINVIKKYHELTPKKIDYYSKYALAGTMLKQQYSIWAGNQD